MVLSIVKIPSPILRMPTKAVDRSLLQSKEIQSLIDDMLETMPAAQGIGLAAPQVNSAHRIAVVACDTKPYVVVNPAIVGKAGVMKESEEGCLSIPGVHGIVPRYAEIKVAALDRFGRRLNIRASGLLGYVFQHEIDHLDGILFVDRAVKLLTQVSEGQKRAFAAYRENKFQISISNTK